VNRFIFILIFSITQLYSFGQEKYVEATVERNNRFAIDYYKTLSTGNENMVLSPFGVTNCMAMAYIGCNKNTQQQIAYRMHFITPFGVLYSFKQLIKRFQVYKSKDVNLLIGNALWPNNELNIKNKYKNLLKVNFQTHVQSLPFSNPDNKSSKLINRWAKKTSNYNIINMVRPEIINKNTKLIYTNFVYLSGNWENPFNKEFTGKNDFFLPDNTVSRIYFMNQTAYLKYNENNVFQIVELPYSGNNISMIVLLPKKLDGVESIEKMINPVNLDFWISGLYTKLVHVSLPKFKSEFRQDVVPVLRNMNCRLPFTESSNFNRISDNKVFVSNIIQHTLIEVSENKSENFTELFVDPDETQEINDNFIRFKANRPFIYLVRDNANGSILLMGKVISPNFNKLSADYNLK